VLHLRDTRATGPDRLRVQVIAALERGPRGVLPVLASAALITGSAGLALIDAESAPGRQPLGNLIAAVGLAALLVAALVVLGADRDGRIWRRGDPWPAAAAVRPSSSRRDLLTVVMLATSGLLPALLLPVHYLAARTHPPTRTWLLYGFLDKRWLTSLYVVAVVAPPLLLVLAARVVDTAQPRPVSWRAWSRRLVPRDTGAAPSYERAGWSGAAATALKVACAVLVAWYFFGPPWTLPPDPIGYHETQAMGGVQGLATGSPPYLDAAAYQYGPGTEVVDYLAARAMHAMSVDGMRETSLLYAWAAAALFLAVLALRAGPIIAVVTALAAFTVFPTFQLFRYTPA